MSDTGRLFAALESDVRRRLLFRLCEEETIEVPEGAKPDDDSGDSDCVWRGQTREGRRTVTTDGSSPRSRTDGGWSSSLELELWHVHLPKLREAGFITWNREHGRVSRGPRFEAVEPALRAIMSNAEAFPDDL